MRPIELTIKGLHSFREKQTVDFESLCDGGVFGIFGPTGSGKSSLLDAITLALYGKVERAGGSTQGILNHAEDELSVNFTFELGIDVKERYRVERVYKRSKTDGLTIGSCRLLRFENEEVYVLADKERDVTQKVKDILGLTHEDFTRAVVLPQGKFAEFLSLKGAERRRMLQRLFNMEKYGDRLNNVIKGRLNDATSKVNAIESAKLELGDASKEAVDTAHKIYKDSDQKVKSLSKDFEAMKEKLDDVKQKKDWQNALHMAEEKEEALVAKTPEIEAIRSRLKNARVASLILPYVKDYEMVGKVLEKARTESDMASEAFSKITVLEGQKQQSYESLTQQIADKTPIYEKHRENLRQAVRIQVELETKNEALAQLKADLSGHQAALEKTEAEQVNLMSQYEKVDGDREVLRDSIKEINISADEREEVIKAFSEKRDIENTRKALNECQVQWKTLREQMAENENAAQKESEKQNKIISSLRALFTRYEANYYRASGINKSLDMILDWLAEKEEETLGTIQNLNIAHLASELSGHLHEGVPCPVCGSVHHPEPAKIERNDQVEALKEEAKVYRQCSGWVSRAITSVNSHQVAIEQKVNQIKNLSDMLIPGVGPRKDSKNLELATWGIEELKVWITNARDELQGFKQDGLALDERLNPLLEQYQVAAKQNLIFTTQKRQYFKQEMVLKEKIKSLESSMDECLNSWNASYPRLNYSTVESEQERIQALDRKTHTINEKIEKLTQNLEVLKKKVQEINALASKHQEGLIRLDESVKSGSAAIESLQHDYQKAMGEFSGEANGVLEQLETQWASLIEREKLARDDWKKTSNERFETEKRLSNAVTLFKSTNQQAEEKGAMLIEQLKRYEVPSPQAVSDNYMPDDVIHREEEKVKQHDQEMSHVKNELESLKEKIGPNPVSDKVFKEVTKVYKELGENRDLALQERAANEQEWKALTKKHERFKQLEEARLKMADLQSQLQKLSTIFRGNGFVEYMAEEQMEQISRDASERLGRLTRRRYALEVDSGGGFVIRDDANGGVHRPVSSLSGGETFLTSLALALSLSTQIQLRGEVPLQFFFLDEGFGTLDPELLDTVITALEKLQAERLSIGVISHVPELRERLARKLFVEPAEPSGRGSRVQLAMT